MNVRLALPVVAFLFVLNIQTNASAQTTVTTTGGTTNTVPVYTGSAALGNSPISVSGSNVGIGTTSPATKLNVVGGDLGLDAGSFLRTTSGANTNLNYVQLYDANGGMNFTTFYGVGNSGQGYFNFYPATAGGTLGTPAFTIRSSGNVGIGTTSPGYTLDVAGQIHSSTGGVVYPDGTTQTTAWTGALCGGDYAESVDVTGTKDRYEPGDVMVVDPASPGNFLKSSEPYSTLVAGIYSTKPGVVGKRFTDPSRLKKEIPMAMIGIVPTKVSAENGAVHPGDLLVTSSTVGYAMKGTDRARMTGAIVGKALGSVQSGTDVIEVLVTLQ